MIRMSEPRELHGCRPPSLTFFGLLRFILRRALSPLSSPPCRPDQPPALPPFPTPAFAPALAALTLRPSDGCKIAFKLVISTVWHAGCEIRFETLM